MMNTTPRTFVGTTTFQVRGLTCAHCQRVVVSAIRTLHGVHSVTVDRPAGLVTIGVDRPTDRADIAAALDRAGYTLVP